MCQPRRRACFSPEALGVLCVGRTGWQDLDRHQAIQCSIARQVYRPHPAATEKPDDLVLLADRVFQCHQELVVRNRYDFADLCTALEAKRGACWEVSTAVTAVHVQGVSWLGDRKSP